MNVTNKARDNLTFGAVQTNYIQACGQMGEAQTGNKIDEIKKSITIKSGKKMADIGSVLLHNVFHIKNMSRV